MFITEDNFSTPVTFVVPVGDREVLANNFLTSACLQGMSRHEILVQEDFSSAAIAYNRAIDRSSNDLIAFVHSDMIFPETWISDLAGALKWLEANDPNWGVLGCYGANPDDSYPGFVYSNGRGLLGRRFQTPTPVQTLDEIVLIVRKSSGLRFNEDLTGFHLYGADICMTAAARQMKCYAIPAFCIHNTHCSLIVPRDFYRCYREFKKIWSKFLPIQTTCIRVTPFDYYMYRRRLWEATLRYTHRGEVETGRVDDVKGLLRMAQASLHSELPVLG